MALLLRGVHIPSLCSTYLQAAATSPLDAIADAHFSSRKLVRMKMRMRMRVTNIMMIEADDDDVVLVVVVWWCDAGRGRHVSDDDE